MAGQQESFATAVESPTYSVESLQNASAIGDNLKFLKDMLAFIKSLNLTMAEIQSLMADAKNLFAGGFTIEKGFAFLTKLMNAINSPISAGQGVIKPQPGVHTIQAFDFAMVFKIIMMIIEWIGKMKPAPTPNAVASS